MAVKIITAPSVTWTGHSSLISTTGAVQNATINDNTPVTDTTAFNGSGVKSRTNQSGISNWTTQLDCRPNPAIIADTAVVGSFSTSNAYENCAGFTMNIAVDVIETTVFNSSGVSYRTFAPGLYKATGTLTCYADDSNPTILSGNTEASVTFTVTDPDGDGGAGTASSIILSTDLKITSAPVTVPIGDKSGIQYAFETSGNISETGDLAATFLDDLLDSNVLTIPAANTLTISDGTTDYSGSAFVSGLNLTCMVGDPITYQIAAQGAGALSAAAS